MALIIANSPLKNEYFFFWQQNVKFAIGDFNLFSHNGHSMTLLQVINEFLMAIFFLFVGLGLKREMLVGEISSAKKAMLPMIGALGGMLIPALLFWGICHDNPEMLQGFEIPTTTDIAFSLAVLSIFNSRVPPGMKIFLATLAVADDLLSIIINDSLNIVTTTLSMTSGRYSKIFTLILFIAPLIIGNKLKIHKKGYYLGWGMALWYIMCNFGMHTTTAGIIVAFCIPCSLQENAVRYIRRIKDQINDLEVYKKGNNAPLTQNEINNLYSIEHATNKLISPLQELEDHLYKFIRDIVMPLFAFSNMGIDLSGITWNDLTGRVAISIIISLIFGKFIGVFTLSWLGIKCKIATLPEGCSWKAFASMCMLCGTGFTVSVFAAYQSYGNSPYFEQAKLGIICGSIISAATGYLLLNRHLPAKGKYSEPES